MSGGGGDLLGDPDWDEIAARSARILAQAEATPLCQIPWPVLLQDFQIVLDAQCEELARMQMLMHRAWPAPGIADGVQRAGARFGHLVELRRRCRALIGC